MPKKKTTKTTTKKYNWYDVKKRQVETLEATNRALTAKLEDALDAFIDISQGKGLKDPNVKMDTAESRLRRLAASKIKAMALTGLSNNHKT